ncbi:hypothetical protein SCHPADRAFT_890848 [Schizopora paradoxa]|uniref:Hydrophobin n=1 Tax=Schizopora paradoxa TaxID=27342 RepID=A0A0H2RKF1_9AGAM|nr:hypothetical protein SCHPADRAFT_890848 [Schizopora paradoxa]
MLSKLFVAASLALLAVATPTPGGSGNSGPANLCCQQTATANSVAGAGICAIVGVLVQDVTGEVASNCSPITGVGISGTSCTNAPVYCDDFYSSALIGINCSPIIINA